MVTRLKIGGSLVAFFIMLSVAAFAVARGGDLVVAIRADAEPASLDYHIDPYFTASLMNTFVSDQLIFLHPETNVYEPFLATDWEVSDDGLSWTFTLRDDVKFQDDTPFNAEAVKFNIERIKDPATASALAADILGPISSVEVIDEFTVQINYETPFATVVNAIARIPMWSPTALAQYGTGEFDRHLIGTGPFRLVEWIPNSHVRMERWDDYNWGPSQKAEPGPVYLDSLTFRFIGEETILGTIITTDEVNVVMELPPQFVSDFRDNPNYQLEAAPVDNTGIQLIANVTRAPLDNITVRRALRHAVSSEIINNLAYDGEWAELYGPLNQTHPCYWDGANEVYPYNPERARELLDEAGWVDQGGPVRVASGVDGVADGTPLNLTMVILSREEIAEAVEAMMRQVGVGVTIEVVPGPVQLERAQNKDFDYIFQRLRGNDGNLMSRVWNSRNDRPGGWAWSGLRDERLDEILNQIDVELDFDVRCELAIEAQQIVMNYAAQIPTVDQPTYWVLNNNVRDWTLGPEGNWFTVYNTYIED
jgi:peptide/nickel transport system substrate-binding protein